MILVKTGEYRFKLYTATYLKQEDQNYYHMDRNSTNTAPNNASTNQSASRWFINTQRHDIKNIQLIRIKSYLKTAYKQI